MQLSLYWLLLGGAALAACAPERTGALEDGKSGTRSDASAEPPTDAPRITNPSGDCVAPDLGSRTDYAILPEDGLTWLPDCENPRAREYYRVFARSPSDSFILPRPQTAWLFTSSVCTGNHDLRPLFDRHLFCLPTDGGIPMPPPESISVADALAVTHQLHTELRFEVVHAANTRDGTELEAISPPPLADDVLAACQLRPQANSTALQELCEQEQRYPARSTNEVSPGVGYHGVERELAILLNDLYEAH